MRRGRADDDEVRQERPRLLLPEELLGRERASSRCEAISGRFLRAIRHQLVGRAPAGTNVTWRNGGSIGSSRVVGSSRRISASWALATRQSRMAISRDCRRFSSSALARLISSGGDQARGQPVGEVDQQLGPDDRGLGAERAGPSPPGG